jgi:EAL domain-containing protein (putative c-di-GMP-specific phosphodiesterase class I)
MRRAAEADFRVAGAIDPASAGQLVAIITARLPSHLRSGIGLALRRDHVEGRFHRLTLASIFQPVLNAAGETVGHEGFVRAGADRQLSPWLLFSHAAATADPDWLVALDRLCRTLHAGNYFPRAGAQQRLFVGVQPGLIGAVARDHGEVFASILHLLGIAPQRVVIQLPGSLNDDLDRLHAAAQSFAARGYGIAVNYTGGASVLFASALGTQVILKIDPADLTDGTPLPALVADCQRRGLTVLIKRLGDAQALQSALAAGADLVQGYAAGHPEAQPGPGGLHT